MIILPQLHIKIEKWKYNKNYELYVSSLGNFKNKNRKNARVLIGSNGYIMVDTKNGIKSAHRIVLETFKPIKNAESYTVDHLNHNKRDNEVKNLEWVSKEENQARARRDLIKDAEQEQKVMICAWKRNFSTLDEAVIYVINRFHMPVDSDRNKIKKKITASIVHNIEYCGVIWKQKLI